MKRLLLSLLYCILLISGNLASIRFSTSNMVKAENESPPYVKWGKLAMQKTKEKYPNAKIIDYLHVGTHKGAKSSIETFKLWLKGDDEEFGVFVEIEYDTKTEQVIDITFKEVLK
ncbi:DUF3889 domain-containing protein [Bacillus aerolatus]|uniref:DUF3889 domain-containing protein n=1 Tax=Bacillus aerolatus TaxID=2653354 RepID=A0A6I1FK82_9BACI|nr:DUF3889 domain-containing protein [Bacillus aerolatus]KAB7709119.1 DUF3889 domain-containing protein [Bacillus aerolatus]